MTISRLIDAATEIGTSIGDADADAHAKGFQKIDAESDDLHHPGDDTGRLMCDAYDAVGAEGAADVLDAYLTAYNQRRRAHGLPTIAAETLTTNLGWAASIRATPEQIEDMRTAWKQRHSSS